MAFQEGFHPFGGINKSSGNSDDSGSGGNTGFSFGTPHKVIFVDYNSAIEGFEYEPGKFIALPQGPDDPNFDNLKIGCDSVESLTVGDDMLAYLEAVDFNTSPCIAAGLTATVSMMQDGVVESSHPIYVLQPVMSPNGYNVIDVPDASIEVVDFPYGGDGICVSVTIPDIGEELSYPGGIEYPILAINVNLGNPGVG